MYEIKSDKVRESIENGTARYGILLVSDDMTISGDSLFSINTENAAVISDDIELGSICSQQADISILNDNKSYAGKEFVVKFYVRGKGATIGNLSNYTYGYLSDFTYAQLNALGEITDGELIPMGKFTVHKAKKNGMTINLTLYDKLSQADKPYKKQTTSRSANEIENDVLTQLGIENGNRNDASMALRDVNGKMLCDVNGKHLRSIGYDFTVPSIPKGTTCREMLSYIASAKGQIGVLDRYGKYIRKWYGKNNFALSGDSIDTPTLSEQPNTVCAVICNVSEDVQLVSGNPDDNGRIIEFDNPYMNQVLLDTIYRNRIDGMAWSTADINMRLGDPRLDICDMLTYEDSSVVYAIPITSLSYSFDGGLSASIRAVGKTEEEL